MISHWFLVRSNLYWWIFRFETGPLYQFLCVGVFSPLSQSADADCISAVWPKGKRASILPFTAPFWVLHWTDCGASETAAFLRPDRWPVCHLVSAAAVVNCGDFLSRQPECVSVRIHSETPESQTDPDTSAVGSGDANLKLPRQTETRDSLMASLLPPPDVRYASDNTATRIAGGPPGSQKLTANTWLPTKTFLIIVLIKHNPTAAFYKIRNTIFTVCTLSGMCGIHINCEE